MTKIRLSLILYSAGCLLVLSGIFHCLVWMIDGTGLDGPVSWRKPILFGFSAGMTLISLGWVYGKVQRQFGDAVLVCSVAIFMVGEVGLITLQQWRGVASHFNRATTLDSAILFGIEILILGVTLGIFEVTRRSFYQLDAPADMRLAIRGGMTLLSFSCLLGFVLVAWGNYQVAKGESPTTFGAAGVMKFPHGIPMHAIQLLPVLAWTARRLGKVEAFRIQLVALALASCVLFVFFGLLQTFTGRSRFEMWWLSSTVLVAALAIFLPVLIALGIAVYRSCFRSLWDLYSKRERYAEYRL